MNLEAFAREVYTLMGMALTAQQLEYFGRYYDALQVWNEKVNLTAIRGEEAVRVKHFLDSLTCYPFIREPASARVIDVGTGAGFPGLPLKIVHPEIQLTLVDSVGKKLDFCREMVEQFELSRVEIIQARAEDLGRQETHREQYDWALARAVAQMPVLAEYLLPLVKVGGAILAQKGETAPQEVNTASRAVALLGGRFRPLVAVGLPGITEKRFLVIADKVRPTPEKYPRLAGTPARKPLLKKQLSGGSQ